MSERQRERELVLSPNEYAYVLDTTKGHINCYVGPNKTSLAQTDQPVVFNTKSHRFEHVELSAAIRVFPTAPTNWYMVLENPSKSGARPTSGVSNALTELRTGVSEVVRGPASFPLWPGQIAHVIEGHRLESNQYLHVRIYDSERAAEGWAVALGQAEGDKPSFEVGETIVIRGSEVSFFIPPTGAEVIPDADGNRVQDAVTLERMEYCVLVGQDGRRRYIRGEALVVPEAGQRFVERRGRRKFRAVELSETTGIHVKVISPYEDQDGAHSEGEELFITGRDRIYFPREEHVVVRYDGGSEIHHAVAIPKGEGRYVLDRTTGEVRSVLGPRMFLPDPRREVIVRRILSDQECAALFPGNTEVVELNRRLRTGGEPAAKQVRAGARESTVDSGTDIIERGWVPPRTLTLDTRLDGVVSVDVWPGYAVQVVDRGGERRSVVGPATVHLGYDETLAVLRLSRGVPKTRQNVLRTAYLQVAGNKVRDLFTVTTADLVDVSLTVACRVDFDPAHADAWFRVDDYVRMVCEHVRSAVGEAARRVSIGALTASAADLVRAAALTAGESERGTYTFSENGMTLSDVELLGLEVSDPDVELHLEEAQLDAIARTIAVAQREAEVRDESRLQELERALRKEEQQTELLLMKLAEEREESESRVRASAQARQAALDQDRRGFEIAAAKELHKVVQLTVAARQTEHEAEMARRRDAMELRLRELDARVAAATAHATAFSPHLVTAIHRLGDEELLGRIAENFGEMAAIEGRGLLETARKFLDFVPASAIPTLTPAGE